MKIKDKEYLKEARELFFKIYEELPNYLDNINDVKRHKVFMDLKAAQYFIARYSKKLGIITNSELISLKIKRMKDMNGLPKIRKNMIDLGTGWVILNNEEDYLKIEFDNEYLFLEYNSENKCAFDYLAFKHDDGHLAILTRNVLLKLDNLPNLIVERMKKDGHDHEDFLNYVKQTVGEVLYLE